MTDTTTGAACPAPPRTYFEGADRRNGDWSVRTADGIILMSGLVGRKVNIGDKDGGIYEGVTVTACDERTGHLTVTGGGFGVRFRDSEVTPFEGERTILPWDVARGFIHGEAGQ